MNKASNSAAVFLGSIKNHPITKFFLAAGHHILAKPLKVTSFTWQILRHPFDFAQAHVGDEGERRFPAAVKFFFTAFVVAFALQLLSSQFALHDGHSEARELIKLFLQIIIGALIIYPLLHMFCDRLKIGGLLQIALYIGAVYLFIGTIISIPIAYYKYTSFLSVPVKAVDVFATELERCLAHESLLYWAVRGEMQLNLYSDLWRPDSWAKWFLENWYYFLIIPFSLIFARMVKAKYGGSTLAIVLAGCIGGYLAQASVNAGEEWIVDNYSRTTPACYRIAADEVAKKYSVALIADQLEYKLGNELTKSLASGAIFQDVEQKPALARKDRDFLLSIQLKPQPDRSAEQFHDWAERNLKAIYCSQNVYWEMLRKMNYRLVVSIAERDAPAYSKNYEPQACGS